MCSGLDSYQTWEMWGTLDYVKATYNNFLFNASNMIWTKLSSMPRQGLSMKTKNLRNLAWQRSSDVTYQIWSHLNLSEEFVKIPMASLWKKMQSRFKMADFLLDLGYGSKRIQELLLWLWNFLTSCWAKKFEKICIMLRMMRAINTPNFMNIKEILFHNGAVLGVLWSPLATPEPDHYRILIPNPSKMY